MTGFGIIVTSCTPEVYGSAMEYLLDSQPNKNWEECLLIIYSFLSRLPIYIVAASITFILGYEVGITGGLTIMDSFLNTFFQTSPHDDHNNNPFFKFNRPGLPDFISSFYTTALVTWIIVPFSLFGKPLMVVASICLVCGSTLTCFATTLTTLVGGRMLLGSGIGVSLHIMPIYVSNITPPMNPRLHFHVFQLVVSLGVIVAGVANDLGWRIGLGGAILPALVALVFSCCLPKLGDKVSHDHNESKWVWGDLFLKMKKKKNMPHLVTATLLPLLHQLTGINLIVMFTPMILRATGELDDYSAIRSTGLLPMLWIMIRACCEMVVPLAMISRRKLLIMFGVFMVISDNDISNSMGWFKYGKLTRSPACCSLSRNIWGSYILINIGFTGWEYISWTFLNETLPQEIRGVALRLSMSVVLICYALVAHFGLPLFAYLQLKMFAMISCLVIFCMLIFYTLLPDNKWSSITTGFVVFYLWQNHFFWKGYLTSGDTTREQGKKSTILSSECVENCQSNRR